MLGKRVLVAALSAELVMGTGPGALSLGTAWAPSLSMSFLIGWTVTRGLYVYVTACYYFFLSHLHRPVLSRVDAVDRRWVWGCLSWSDSSMSHHVCGVLIMLASDRSLLLLRTPARARDGRVLGAYSTSCCSDSKDHINGCGSR
ncbi:hypothetical protein OH76DRAFT_1019357 [Lentinus brumalis]|uniref:Uncharacterized protein n=1 Tax=Lentinus brumalis TaxID=2498619 RepID=A0A371CXS9_9APHY|nr:hypothetical protein OH76DRAFT_1019357 [Polyporus brumalis]